MQKGKASLLFEHPVYIAASASAAGEKEGEGSLSSEIDLVEQDPLFGTESWELAESAMQKRTAELAIKKGGFLKEDIRYLFAGDLLGQLIATSFGTGELSIPLFGLYGACSTMGEAMGLGAMCVDAGYADRVLAMASSHYATAEKQFRFPLAYGNQRPKCASWTVTGCGAVVISGVESSDIRIKGITTGKVVDLGTRDSMNMGASMAPAAWDTIRQNFCDLDVDETYYDQIITGDLGEVGQRILFDFMDHEGINIREKHMDCGLTIYDNRGQDTHSGGSGCGCAAVTLCAHILPNLRKGIWKRVLFVPTGALHSTVSYNEGQTIPAIAHGVVLEREVHR